MKKIIFNDQNEVDDRNEKVEIFNRIIKTATKTVKTDSAPDPAEVAKIREEAVTKTDTKGK